ncbi:MAG: bifunctional hydroxymethylpyrimidine kinase/phosphomethylpyrimidine kinase [Deltaproteobacteria bacterium RIFCSPLOWO2_02_56_12]|nr:MAG: bifunctional hydroxymethylpyrimidine kinase/phosphomethylpyrimidine kinase [Deltaproteobacteria bacterium RIFCSPLOWO2_02_56_12]
MRKPIYKALTIAGSDSGAGAGIQADLKTFAAFGVYGTSVITAITAQNTVGVTKILELPADLVAAQLDAVVEDIGAQALKTGMLANSAIIEIVAEKIREHRLHNLVVDPVMVAKGGDLLLRPEAIEALRSRLIPLAVIVTPNLPEAEQLTGIPGSRLQDIKESARRIIAMGARSVVIKGGHRKGPATDIFYDGKKFRELSAPRVRTPNTHGTGCTFSAAIAAGLAKGEKLENAVVQAKRYITQAIRKGFPIGSGHSPVHHFYRFWK